MKITTSKGMDILFDDEDWPLVAEYTWCNRNGYAATTIWVDGASVGIYMHRLLLGLGPRKPFVDHINRNRADNRRQNLRIVTQSENLQNRGPNKDNALGIRGVCRAGNRFRAYICVRRTKFYLGSFETPELAKEFRDLASEMLL